MSTTYATAEQLAAYDIKQLERQFAQPSPVHTQIPGLKTREITIDITKVGYKPAQLEAKTTKTNLPTVKIEELKTSKPLVNTPVRGTGKASQQRRLHQTGTAATFQGSKLKASSQIPRQSLASRFALRGLGGGTPAFGFTTQADTSFIISGVIDGLSRKQTLAVAANSQTVRERGGYKFGYNIGETINLGVGQTIRDIDQERHRTWERISQIKPPEFEIPKVTIPKIQIPKFPEIKPPSVEIKFPEIPKLKIPIPIQKPKPIPRPQTPTGRLEPPISKKREEIREITGTQCGSVTVRMFYAKKISGYSDEVVEGIGRLLVGKDVPLEEILTVWGNARPNEDLSTLESQWNVLTSAGGTGVQDRAQNSTTSLQHRKTTNVRWRMNANGGRTNGTFPFYEVEAIVVKSSNPIAAVVDLYEQPDRYGVSGTRRQVQVIEYTVENPDGENCTVPEVEVPTEPEIETPPEPKERCCMACNHEKINYRKIKRLVVESLQEQEFTLTVPIVTCVQNKETGKWEPRTEDRSIKFFATSLAQAQQLALLHKENAKQMTELCIARNNSEPVTSLPLSWQIRNEGDRPQLVIQCAQKLENGKYDSAKYPISVPHWKGKATDKVKLPVYTKGNYEGILTLKDNSKVTINAANHAECTKILNAIKPWIAKDMLEGSRFKGGKINVEIKNTKVRPMYGRYFSTGQKNTKPDWRIDFV